MELFFFPSIDEFCGIVPQSIDEFRNFFSGDWITNYATFPRKQLTNFVIFPFYRLKKFLVFNNERLVNLMFSYVVGTHILCPRPTHTHHPLRNFHIFHPWTTEYLDFFQQTIGDFRNLRKKKIPWSVDKFFLDIFPRPTVDFCFFLLIDYQISK